jgi:hypothetical protein
MQENSAQMKHAITNLKMTQSKPQVQEILYTVKPQSIVSKRLKINNAKNRQLRESI